MAKSKDQAVDLKQIIANIAKDDPHGATALEELLVERDLLSSSLDEQMQKFTELEEKAREKELKDSGDPVAVDGVAIGNGYEFTVGPRKKGNKGLPEKRIKCCDESEALRWYCDTTRLANGKRIRPDDIAIGATIDAKDHVRRELFVDRMQRLARIRRNRQEGGMVTQEEIAELMEYEEQKRKELIDAQEV